jgi:hypothetical protein
LGDKPERLSTVPARIGGSAAAELSAIGSCRLRQRVITRNVSFLRVRFVHRIY